MVCWERGARISLLFWRIYRQASQNTRTVAKELSALLIQLHDETGMRFDDVHLIGHSLGAQIAGYVGMHIRDMRQKLIGRISGMYCPVTMVVSYIDLNLLRQNE